MDLEEVGREEVVLLLDKEPEDPALAAKEMLAALAEPVEHLLAVAVAQQQLAAAAAPQVAGLGFRHPLQEQRLFTEAVELAALLAALLEWAAWGAAATLELLGLQTQAAAAEALCQTLLAQQAALAS